MIYYIIESGDYKMEKENSKKETKQYYDGTKLLSLKDVNGNTPEIYICTSNRNGGKTTFFNRLLMRRFLKYRQKFALLYRYNYELGDCADKYFKDIGSLFFPGYSMTYRKGVNDVYNELLLWEPGYEQPTPCGYVLALNKADQIKKVSHLMSDTGCILFDEFQSETNNYCDKEVDKFMSVHTSLARGQGKQVRYLPVYMLSNTVSIINPYYTALGISSRLNDAKFFRGDGFVLEQGYVEAAANAQMESAFNRAFAQQKYLNYAACNVYLNDSQAFIADIKGNGRYLATLRYQGKEYGIREYPELGIIYCNNRPDTTYRYKISVTTDDHDINYVMLKRNDMFIQSMRWYFERGCFRFKDLNSKEALMAAISY